MATRIPTGTNVYDEALMRLVALYQDERNFITYSFSTGKDSGVCVELGIQAAQMTGRLPIDVIMRDEEVLFPGSFEYAERLANRPEVRFHWVVAHQPIVNVYNRREPYFWVFDPLLEPQQWVRQPPSWATKIDEQNIAAMVIPKRFAHFQEGQRLMTVIGLRVQESRARSYGLYSSKGYITKPNEHGVRNIRPIYDWTDGDVWLAHKEGGWDYNKAYDAMHKLGMSRSKLRIAPPTLNMHGAESLALAAKAWPRWFDAVCQRLPGVRSVALFGRRACTPKRRVGETWEQTFWRECVLEAPAPWIARRAETYLTKMMSAHRHHSTSPLPEVTPCVSCARQIGSWKSLTMALYNGDPFALKCEGLPFIEPEFFRPQLVGTAAGKWGGKPSF